MATVATKQELESLKARISTDFGNLFSNPELRNKLAEYLLLIGFSEEDVYSFFEENEDILNHLHEHFKEYSQHRYMFFWRLGLNNYISLDDHQKLDNSIREIVKYILNKEEDLLVKDIGEYLQEKMQELNDFYDNRENVVQYNYKKIIRDIAPYMFLMNDSENEFYPVGLFEKMRRIIPADFLKYFKYELYNISKASKDYYSSGSSNRKEEKIEPKINFNTESNEAWTKKDFYDKWKTLVESNEENSHLQYAKLLTKWQEHLDIKLLRKEFEKENKDCITGVMYSENEYAVRALYVYIIKHNIKIPYANEIPLSKESTNINFYKLLIKFFTNSENVIDYILNWYGKLKHNSDFMSKCYEFDLHNYQQSKYLWQDFYNIIDSNTVNWEKIKKFFEPTTDYTTRQIFYDPFRKLTSEEYDTLPKYGEECVDNEWDIYGTEFINQNRHENTDIGRITIPVWQIDFNERQYCRVKFWLYEHKELNLQNLELDDNACEELRNITLEKPFLFPKWKAKHIFIPSNEDSDNMKNYLYKELSFGDFCQQEQQDQNRLSYSKLWHLYLKKFIEDTYKAFVQPSFEKPLLPIIPEYAEYLLSRTDDLFSTAIKGIIHNEFEFFLTECRKLQIDKLVKNGTLRQEDRDKLAELYSRCYAWSDEEIKEYLPDADFEKLHSSLEPEFMVRVFEKSILWVLEHKTSELWKNAPWYGMQIFDKSYADRPSIWAKHLIRIAMEWNGSENILLRICFALGHLREPLDGDVPRVLQEIANKQKEDSVKERILTQKNLFNRENFERGHHRSAFKRVEACKAELIRGQNNEVL